MTGETMNPLVEAIIVGDCAQSINHARNLFDSGISAEK